MTALIYVAAALAEIGGCFAFWMWLRLGKSIAWTVPGTASLLLFAYFLTLVPTDAAGRAFAAYGGVYIVASLAWMWAVETVRPDSGTSQAQRSAWPEPRSSCSARAPSKSVSQQKSPVR